MTETGLELPVELTFEEWAGIGNVLGTMARATPWLLGDWVNYGDRAYGETYAQALSETGLSYAYLSNAAWICRRVPPSRRREKLSFGHHEVVAPMTPAEQKRWLREAEKGEWTRATFREQVQHHLHPPERPTWTDPPMKTVKDALHRARDATDDEQTTASITEALDIVTEAESAGACPACGRPL